MKQAALRLLKVDTYTTGMAPLKVGNTADTRHGSVPKAENVAYMLR
jgi:hypothetical protein